MSTTKNYGLAGIGADVQLGKAGGRLIYAGGVFKFTEVNGSTLDIVQVATPVNDDDATTKAYVDSVAAGLDPKESCRVATTADPGGTYNSSGGTGGTGEFTATTDTIDGISLVLNDRILVKDDATQTQNGIYVVTTVGTGADGVWERSADQDGSPASEVSSGNFTFIEQGTDNANSGWVLQGDGILDLNTDNIVWVQFSGAGTYDGGIGITLTSGTDFDLDFNDGQMSSSVAMAGGDLIAFADISVSDTMQIRTATNMMADLDIVNSLGGNGFAVQTSADNYTARTITVDGAGNKDGLIIANGDGVSANPVIGLDVVGLPALTGTIALTDSIVIYDLTATANVKDTWTNVFGDLDVPNAITANGIVTRTAEDTYTSRAIAASAVSGDEGISVVNGSGISGNPTIGIDIQGTTALVAAVATGDSLLMFDTTAGTNLEVTVDQLKTYMNAGTSSTSISEGDSSVAVSDSGTGLVTTTIDAATVIVTQVGDTTFGHNVIINEISAITAAPIPAFKISGQTTGTPATGIGVEMEFEVETSAGGPGNLETGGTIQLVSTDITGTSEDFDFVFTTMAGGATAVERMRISSTGAVSATSFTASSLTDNRVLIAGTAGLIEDDANFTFNGSILALTAAMDITGDLDVDNINLNGNTISITDTNGNLNLQANGTGDTRVLDGAGNEIIEFLDGSTGINHISVIAGGTGVAPTISTNVTGAETNVDLNFTLNGTGVLAVTAGTGNYEDNVTADDDIPNKKYVDDLISAGATGGVLTASATVDFTSATAQTVGTLPANATVLRTMLHVGTASDAVTTVTVGDATNGASSYMAATENDPEETSTFNAGTYVLNGAGDRTIQATVATAGSTGSGVCVVEYRLV